MSALTQIPEYFPTEFDTNWSHLVQQTDSRLSPYVTLDTIRGKEKTINQLGTQAMSRVNVRAGNTREQDLPMAKRWLRAYPYDLANIFDEWDEEFLGEIVLPKSEVMQTHINAYNRTRDSVIVSALGDTAYTGEDGTTGVAFPSSQIVAANYVRRGTPANSGLTLAKLIKAKSILGKNEIDPMEPMVFAYSQQQLDDLLNDVLEVKNTDYNAVHSLVTGTVDTYMGFKFVKLELMPLASNIRTCYAFVKSGVRFAPGPRRSFMDILPQRSHALQVRTTATLGAVRAEEKKVVQILCDETA